MVQKVGTKVGTFVYESLTSSTNDVDVRYGLRICARCHTRLKGFSSNDSNEENYSEEDEYTCKPEETYQNKNGEYTFICGLYEYETD